MRRFGTNSKTLRSTAGDQRLLIALTLVAFALRLTLRLARGEADFLESGYTFYVEIAQTFLGGGGLCFEGSTSCAMRVPAYPILLAPFLATGSLYPGIVIVQAAIGAGLVWLAWAIGRYLFDRTIGLLAAAAAAFNPYAVTHDTALQETGVVNTLIAVAVWVLLRGSRSKPGVTNLASGLALSVAVLTAARVALLVPFAMLWVVAFPRGQRLAVRARRALLVAFPIVLLLGGWTIRNWIVVGAPVLTTKAGENFWIANNEWAFEFLPDRSIDLAAMRSYEELPIDRQRALEALNGRDIARDRLLASWGWEYVSEHPGGALWKAGRKLWSVTSGRLSPSYGRSQLQLLGYTLVFAPTHLLAVIGLWRKRHSWHGHLLMGFVLLAFAATTAVFYAHTSHKSYLDVFLFVYAAAGLMRLYSRNHQPNARP